MTVHVTRAEETINVNKNLVGKTEEERLLKDQGVDGRKLPISILKKQDVRMWAELSWLRT